jgi:DNA-directed RNA polymerase subunit H (RpoH/RPB5)
MFNPYKFHNIHPILRPARLLTDQEKTNVNNLFSLSNSHMHTIYIDDYLASGLDANIGDIVSVQYPSGEIYRRVIPRKLTK